MELITKLASLGGTERMMLVQTHLRDEMTPRMAGDFDVRRASHLPFFRSGPASDVDSTGRACVSLFHARLALAARLSREDDEEEEVGRARATGESGNILSLRSRETGRNRPLLRVDAAGERI